MGQQRFQCSGPDKRCDDERVALGVSGHPGEGEVRQVHQFFSLRFRIVSGEGDGCDGGVSQWSCQEGRSRLTAVLA